MQFPLNEVLIAKAHAIMAPRRDVYWIIGAACAGKSTVCRRLADKTGIAVYDMDEHFYGSYMSCYRQERHPAAKTWFSAPNPLAWALSLSWEEFNALNRAALAECLDLFADDLTTDGERRLLVDGGITHPAVLTRVILPDNVFCIETTAADRVRAWETAKDRAEMRSWVLALPNAAAMWQKFLCFDEMIAQTIAVESHECGIRTFPRDEATSVDELANTIAAHFGVGSTQPPCEYRGLPQASRREA